MSRAGLLAVSLTLAGAAAAACGPKRIAQPTAPKPTLVVLLPDEDGTTGRARISNEYGGVDLRASRLASDVTPDRRPSSVWTMNEDEIEAVFGPALLALPPAPRRFTLRFRFESDELTDESRALLPTILEAVKEYPVPEVAVIGHTDTLGDAESNVELGMKRAQSVYKLLVGAGVEPSIVDVRSHGETDLLVKTGDDRAEPRNRRVEIRVR